MGHAVVSDRMRHCPDGVCVRPPTKERRSRHAVPCSCMQACMRALTRARRWLPLTMFMTMGWMGALLAVAIFPFVGFGGIALLLAGGIAYSVRPRALQPCLVSQTLTPLRAHQGGGWIYQSETPNPVPGRFGFHEIWHVAVIVGALFHFGFMCACPACPCPRLPGPRLPVLTCALSNLPPQGSTCCPTPRRLLAKWTYTHIAAALVSQPFITVNRHAARLRSVTASRRPACIAPRTRRSGAPPPPRKTAPARARAAAS